MNFKYLPGFISNFEAADVIRLGESLKPSQTVEIQNEHIKKINEGTYGFTVLADLTKTPVSKSVAQFQGDSTVIESVPPLFHEIADRIASQVGIVAENVFCQYIALGAHGRVPKHYDAGLPGYVTYKCNISLVGPEPDKLFVDKSKFDLWLNDLYCFEANFYKHWLDASDYPRALLSYGFIVPLADFGYSESDSRVRLSDRIWKAFISSK